MQNPCDQCLINVMCSEICFKKKNYTSLLKDAIEKTNPIQKSGINTFYMYNTDYSKYLEMARQNSADIRSIERRKNGKT